MTAQKLIRNYDMNELKKLDMAHHLPAQSDYKLQHELGGSRIITRAGFSPEYPVTRMICTTLSISRTRRTTSSPVIAGMK